MTTDMIRIAIYEDNDSLRETLSLIFDVTIDLVTVGRHPNALSVVTDVDYDRPDVILMDIDMPGRTGIEAVRLLSQAGTLPKVLMLTVFDDTDRIFSAIEAGAVGYLLKKTPANQIADAIREVAAGGAPMTPSIALKVLTAFRQSWPKPTSTQPPKFETFSLTDRESEVLQRLVAGDSYKLIADNCQMSMGTVRSHIVAIYQKLHVNSKSEAVAKALKTNTFR